MAEGSVRPKGRLAFLTPWLVIASLLLVPAASAAHGGEAAVSAANDTVPPTANAGPNQTVDQNQLVTFDGSGSTDNVGIVNYTWTLPTAPGAVRTVSTLSVGGSQAVFDPVRPVAYVLGTNQVYVVNLTTGAADATFALAHNATWPMSLAVAPQGTYLAVGIPVGDRGYYDFGPYLGYLAGFDLKTRTKLGEWSVANDIYRVLATGDGYGIVAGGSGQWAALEIYNLRTGSKSPNSGTIWQNSDVAMHPNGTRIYSVDQEGIYPPSVHRYDFTSTGGFSSWLTWPYFGTYPGGEIWVSSGGDRILVANGMLLTSTDSASTDMTQVTILPSSPISSATFAPSLGVLVVVVGTTMNFLDDRTFALLGSRDLGGSPTALAVRGLDVYALVGGEIVAVRMPRVHLYGVSPTYAFPDAGTFVVTLTVRDAAGNTGNDSVTITVRDTTPPIADAGWNQTVSPGAVVIFYGNGSTDNVGIVNYTWALDDGGLRTLYGPTPWYRFMSLGTFVVTLTVRDAAGNSASATVTIDVRDLAPPRTAATVQGVQGVGGWYRSNVTVTLDAVDALSGPPTTNDSVDGGPWQPYTAPFTVTGQGTHLVRYYSTDLAGNQESIHNLTVSIDWTAPTITATASGTRGPSGWFLEPARVFLLPLDSVSGVAYQWYRVDGGSWQAYYGVFSLQDGAHTVDYYAIDIAGNSAPVASLSVPVDTRPPVFTNTGPLGTFTSSAVRLTWSAHDDGSGIAGFRVSVDGGGTIDVGNATSTVVTLADGTHTVVIEASDLAGHAASFTASFGVDTDVFSLSGPFHGMLEVALMVTAAAVGVAVAMWRLRPKRRTPAPPASGPGGPSL